MNKHTATINGQTFTRNSKTRVYTHTVVARLDRAACEKSLLANAEKNSRTNYEFYCGKGKCNAYTDWQGVPKPYTIHGKDYTSATEYMADYPTLQDDINYEVDRAQKIIDSRMGDYYNTYINLGWNGRVDLAEKLASSTTHPHYRDITILEATVK